MSIVDYTQSSEDHQSLLILVKHTGKHLTCKQFNHAWEKISQLQCISVQGQKRNVWLRYKRGYPKENNEWGDFQAHRKVLGLISVGHCHSHQDFEDLFNAYKKVKEDYSGSLYNSRLIVLGLNRDGSPLTQEDRKKVEQLAGHLRNGDSPDDNESSNENINGGERLCSPVPENSVSECEEKDSAPADDSNVDGQSRSHSNSLTKESTGAEVVFYPCLNQLEDLDDKLVEFFTSLFFVLEGKRLDRSFERTDKPNILCAPFEKKDFVGIDTDTKSFKRKCMARLKKHLGDLCLQAGIPGEAMLHYQTSLDIFKSLNDFLWMAACYEGLCSASVIFNNINSKPVSGPLKRNQSFNVKGGSSIESKIRGGSIHGNNSVANGLDLFDKNPTKITLNPDDILEKYKEAVSLYSKYKFAALIEMEASMKACRILIQHRKYLQASDFLQNVMYINVQTGDEDKILRYSTLASLYSQIGFRRKASFFYRVAAMQCIAPNNPQPSWFQCYHLLFEALEGYSISVNPKEFIKDRANGWPVLQQRVLHELVYSTKRMGNFQLAVRHMTFLLHTMHDKMNLQDKKDAVANLETLTMKCGGHIQPLKVDKGLILPPVPLTYFPTVRSFRLLNYSPHYQPVQLKSQKSSSDDNIFIYTPLVSISQDKSSDELCKVDFDWVCDDVCEIQLQVFNPLPEELDVANMSLLTEGVEVECFPANFNVPRESGLHTVIIVKPKTVGQLKIFGYSSQVLGVKSHCYLEDVKHINQRHFIIDIVPALPQIQVSTSLPKAASFSSSTGDCAKIVANAATVLYAGQSLESMVTVQNIASLPVEKLNVSFEEKEEHTEFLRKVFQWNDENIQSQLPIQSAHIMCFTLCVNGFHQFLSQEILNEAPCSPVQTYRPRTDSNEKCVEAVLRMDYSGGPGMVDEYCRQCAIAITVEILPSLVFCKWDVLSSESSNHCYLVLDIQNVSGHQIQVEYSTSQSIIIEPKQIRRIAVEIERCVFPPHNSDAEADEINYLVPKRKSKYISEFVNIRWSIPAIKTSGKASIEYLQWSPSQLELIAVSPVSWEIKLNDEEYSPLSAFEFQMGKPVELDVTLTNQSELCYERLVLYITCCQDDDNGNIICDIDSTFSVFDSSEFLVNQIQQGQSVNYQSTFLFWCCGSFKFDIKCISMDTSQSAAQGTDYKPVRWQYSPAVSIEVIG